VNAPGPSYLRNKPIDLADFNAPAFRLIVDDMHRLMRVPRRKRNSGERCTGRSLIEPVVLESYKHWDNPWAVLNASLGKGMRVLDCGSGRGILQFYLARRGATVHSIDISDNRSKFIHSISRLLARIGIRYTPSPYAVHRRLNRKYRTSVDFLQAGGQSLPYPPGHFDRIFCISVIEHMPDDVLARSMKEMERVLKPGGLILLTFDFHPHPDTRIIGFTEEEFRKKALDHCGLRIEGAAPAFSIKDWQGYIKAINDYFKVQNPNTSYGVILKK
jgi:ubiquinone/menaquinone biosynthesis C-methylase UbiE